MAHNQLIIGESIMTDKKIFGATALFNDPNAIIAAARKVASAGFSKWDVNSPYPIHGIDKAMKMKPSKLGIVTLIFGLSGTVLALILMWWTMSVDYPMVIGGKPYFSLPAFIPVTFEVTVIMATVSTVIAMFAFFFGLPRNTHALHDTDYMKKVSRDHYGIVIESIDPKFDERVTLEFLKSLNPLSTEIIYIPEKEGYPIFEPKFLGFLFGVAVVVSLGTYLMLNKLMYIEPFDWMDNQAKIIPQTGSDFFADGRGMRLPIEGTVARGFIPYPFEGENNPTEVLSNPYFPTEENLKLGQQKYLTYCSPCHGNFGDGDSRLQGQFPNPPTFHSERARNFQDGMIYHIITVGQNVMPSYASHVTREERWAVVNYVRALQRAKNATDSDLKIVKAE
jgi:mono/diheme cytochrome c family protein